MWPNTENRWQTSAFSQQYPKLVVGACLQKLAWKMRSQSRMRLLSSHCVQLSAPIQGYCPEDVHILNVVRCVKRLILIYFAIQIPKK
jgi:hypothetical protein